MKEITEDTILMRCDDFIFYNSKAVFIEYIDVIRSPYFSLLYLMSNSDASNPLFDTKQISKIGMDNLRDYYYNRRNQNPLYDLLDFENNQNLPEDILEKVDIFTDKEITKEILQYTNKLNFVDVIVNLMHADSLIAKQVVIYYPYDNLAIKQDIAELFSFNSDIEFRSGSLDDVLKDIPKDATYVFSDIGKIETLRELDRLNFASILVPMEYGYNYTDPQDKESDLLLDIEAYMKEYTFKFDMFLASISLPKNNDSDEFSE